MHRWVPQANRMVSNLICKYLGWFSLRFVHFVSISWILYFSWIFWLIFSQNWYFRLLLQNRISEWFHILIYEYLGWFSLRFVHSVSISWVLYFLWIFWFIFGQNWYFRLLLQNRSSEWFQIWYASTLGGSLSDLFILCQYLEFCILGEYFKSFLAKTDIFNLISKTAT